MSSSIQFDMIPCHCPNTACSKGTMSPFSEESEAGGRVTDVATCRVLTHSSLVFPGPFSSCCRQLWGPIVDLVFSTQLSALSTDLVTANVGLWPTRTWGIESIANAYERCVGSCGACRPAHRYSRRFSCSSCFSLPCVPAS